MHLDPKRELVQKRSGQLGLAGLAIIVAVAILAPLLATHDPLEQTVHSLQPPSFDHLLGTNQAGQDIWSQLVYGARTSLVVGLVVAVLGTFLGFFVGTSAALAGGWYDRIVMRVVDALLVIPLLILLILLSVYLGYGLGGGGVLAVQLVLAALLVLFAVYMVRGLGLWGLLVALPFAALALLSRDLLAGTGGLIIILALFGWQGGARIIRSQALSLKERGHVTAARGSWGGEMVHHPPAPAARPRLAPGRGLRVLRAQGSLPAGGAGLSRPRRSRYRQLGDSHLRCLRLGRLPQHLGLVAAAGGPGALSYHRVDHAHRAGAGDGAGPEAEE